MRYLIIFLMLLPFLSAKSPDTCFSVQVKSFHLKHNSSYDFHRKGYPSSCKLMKLSSMYAVRCGCFNNYSEAENALDKLSEIYYDAIIVNTYIRRFGNNFEQEQEEYQNPIPQKKRYSNEFSSNSSSFAQRYNDIDLEENREEKKEDFTQESSFDNDFEDDDLSEYGYE